MGELGAVEESSECREAAAWYRKKLDWPCTAAGHAVWTLAGQALDAVDLPSSVGDRLVTARPAIEVPGDEVCLRFLVEPSRFAPHRLVTELTKRGAVYHRHASVVELPPTRVPGGALRWLTAPNGTLPTLAELIGALLPSEHKSSER